MQLDPLSTFHMIFVSIKAVVDIPIEANMGLLSLSEIFQLKLLFQIVVSPYFNFYLFFHFIVHFSLIGSYVIYVYNSLHNFYCIAHCSTMHECNKSHQVTCFYSKKKIIKKNNNNFKQFTKKNNNKFREFYILNTLTLTKQTFLRD